METTDCITKCASSPGPARIPRHIGNLNALAVAAGLDVEMVAEPYGDDPEIRLWSSWRGPAVNFLALVQPVASYRLPLRRGHLNIPGGAGYYHPNALISGVVTVAGNDVLFEIDFGPSEFTIADAAGVEIVSYRDETLYHGDTADLIALGIDRSRLPTQKRPARRGYDYKAETEDWSTRRQPDGLIVHRVESPAHLRARRARVEDYANNRGEAIPGGEKIEARSYLRLVVDNTRENADG